MKEIILSIVVLLVFAQHQGSCWLESPDEPFSAVRHLSASRQLRDSENDLDDSSSGIIDTAAISGTPRPLFSWELVTVTPASSTSFPIFHDSQDESDNSDVSFVEQRKQRGKKMRNKKKKKKKVELIDEGEENLNWHGSNINMSSSTVDSNGNNNIPDSVVSGITRRRKHKNKMKKNKGKSYTEYDEEGVTKKRKKSEKSKQDRKQKVETSKEEKARKENKRKERKRMREERRQKQEKRKKDRLNENSPEVLMTEISMKSRSKNKTKFEMMNPELNLTMPSSSENTVEAVSGKYRRDRPLDINTEKYNDYNLEVVKNEINAGELPALYIPHNEPHKPFTKESTDDNNSLSGILFPGIKENAKEDTKESFKEVQNENKITLKENDISSTNKLLTSANEKTVSNSNLPVSDIKPNATKTEEITTVVNNQILSGNEMESHTELELDLTTEPTENGDLSCLSPTFLPAQPVKNAEIKYTRGKYLEAEYECLPDFKLVPEDAPRLVCSKRQWIGDLPECQPVSKNPTNDSMKPAVIDAINNNASCGDNRGGCEQLCTLVEGKPVCSCFRGFRLEGSTCHDIDECADSNGGCEVSCHNKPGSYECGCPSGFRLSVNGKSCLDINECLLRNGHGPCQDSCQNLPGSYKCSCEGIEGTRLSTDNHTCEDLDECARNNAGCSHTCLNTLGRAFCLCPPGFMLGTDWKTCHDIDECADPELQEGEHCSIGCVNTLGSYHCADLRDQAPDEHPTTPVPSLTTTAPTTTIAPVNCLPGFEAGPYGSCKDIDECATNNGGCSHTCKNTLGSAFCLCPPEFMLASDWKTCKEMHVRTTVKPKIPIACPPGHVVTSGGRCKDVDECAIQNGGCMQGCVNIRGSFQCVCGRGFFLAADGKTCVEERVDIVCPPLPTPSYGYLHCTRRVFMVAPEQWRARWRRRIVNHAGAVCELRCPHGYRVQGEYRKVCESDGNWAGPEDGYCMPFPKPKIECPHNISVEIEPGQATAFVAFPQPVTDVDWFRNVVSKPSWGKLLEADLPIGRWSVTFTARHPISRHTASCTLGIKISSPALSTEVPKELA